MTPEQLVEICEEVRTAATREPVKFAKQVFVWMAERGFAAEVEPGDHSITPEGHEVVQGLLGRLGRPA